MEVKEFDYGITETGKIVPLFLGKLKTEEKIIKKFKNFPEAKEFFETHFDYIYILKKGAV